MKPKIQTVGITFYTSPSMYSKIKKSADAKLISNSELIRIAIEYYFSKIQSKK